MDHKTRDQVVNSLRAAAATLLRESLPPKAKKPVKASVDYAAALKLAMDASAKADACKNDAECEAAHNEAAKLHTSAAQIAEDAFQNHEARASNHQHDAREAAKRASMSSKKTASKTAAAHIEAAKLHTSAAKKRPVRASALNTFEDSYVTTMLWSTNDESNDAGGEPLDRNYSATDLSPEAIEKVKKDCTSFKEKAGDLLDGLDDDQVAHDFWLTRNGHGAGFWDGDYEDDVGDKLTELSKTFGEIDPYVGDDGKIHL